MRSSSALVLVAVAAQVAPSVMAAPLNMAGGSKAMQAREPSPFVLPAGLSEAEIAEIQERFRNSRLLSAIAARAGVAGVVAKPGVGSAIAEGVASGLGTLASIFGLNALFKHLDSSNDAATSDAPSKREIIEFLAARETVAGEVGEAVAKVAAKSGLGKTIANGVLGTLTSLTSGAAIAALFDKLSNKDPATRRAILEYIAERADTELATRSLKREILASMLEARSINDLD